MKLNKSIIFSLLALVILASLYRIFPNRPLGFAPQIAMALFGGSLFVNKKKWAFILPIGSMFLSDCLYQLLYLNDLTTIRGFYGGQWVNYLLFAGITFIGFAVKINKVPNIIAGILAAPTAYFIISNVLVWVNGGGYHRPKTTEGFVQCFVDALPFYQGSLIATAVFGGILFGGYALLQNNKKALAI